MYLGLNEPSDFLSGFSRDPGSVLALIEARNSRQWHILVKYERSCSAPDVGNLLYGINTGDHKCSCLPFNNHWIVQFRHGLCHVASLPQLGIVWEGNSAEGASVFASPLRRRYAGAPNKNGQCLKTLPEIQTAPPPKLSADWIAIIEPCYSQALFVSLLRALA